jgi:diguanylate cyclase (GGDEF)-like protein
MTPRFPDHLLDHKPVRRLLALPATLLALLVFMPWALEYVEDNWLPPRYDHFGVTVDSLITALLGLWILTMIRREQATTRHHLRELELLSLTDPLTGLGNRRAFERDLEVALSRAHRTEQPLALLYIDVDGLKRVNDRFGHAIGDETLRVLGAVLRSSSRLGIDAAYRVGGDEFVMVLNADVPSAESISGRVAERFRERSPHGSRVSSGVVVWDGQAHLQQLIDAADTRMYQRKYSNLGVAPA